MKTLKKFLLNNGFELWDLDENLIDGQNEYIKILVYKNEKDNEYVVRNAIRCYFDRWTNSGGEIKFRTEDEVIEYLNTPEKYIKDAVGELVWTIVEDSKRDKNYSKVDKMIDLLYGLVKEESKDEEND